MNVHYLYKVTGFVEFNVLLGFEVKLIVGFEYQKGASPVSMSPKRERKDGESIFISQRTGGTPISITNI